MELLQSLIQKLPFFPLSQAAGKLEHLLLNSMDEQDRLLILHLLLVCHRPDVARRELERGPDIATCLTDAPQYVPIHVRAALELGAEPQLPQGPLPPSLPRWVKKYASIGSDLHYPAELTSITLTTKEGVQTVLSFTCPACGGIIATTAQAQWLPIEAEKGEMLCRHCLAKLQWNKSAVRSQVFDYYDRFISSLPRTTEGLLSFENVHSAAMLAVALRPFALIRVVKAFSERIGHFAVDVFVYLRRRLAGLDEPSLDYVSLGSGKVSNATLAELWDRILQFQPFAAQVYDVLRGTEHAYWMFRGGVDPDDGAQRFPLAFPFTAREHEILTMRHKALLFWGAPKMKYWQPCRKSCI